MKKILIFISFLTLSMQTISLEEKKMTAGVDVGGVVLGDKLNDQFENGLGLGFFLNYAASDLLFAEFAPMYSTMNGSSVKANDLTIIALPLSVHLSLSNLDQIAPFFGGGVGFYQADTTYNSKSETKWGFGLNLSLGANFYLSEQFSLGIVAKYHKVFEGTVTIENKNIDVLNDFTTLALRIGYTF